jgi:glycosyltransferase involved in cell wall biosynthesis
VSDAPALSHVARRAAEVAADVVHGHGAKGGAYARLTRGTRAVRAYTPHGGSLHYRWGTPAGFLYLAAERAMMPRTDLFLFESRYGLDAFCAKIGNPGRRARVVHNGVGPDEFDPVAAASDATALVFIGELRHLKGVDVLIAAVAQLAREGRRVTATIVGEGPDRAAFEQAALPLGETVRFAGALPARAAFARGRLLIVPSRAESLPYVVLEAVAAGKPLIASNVGGIPEIFGPDAASLVSPGDPAARARAIWVALENPQDVAAAAVRLQHRVRDAFSTDAMTQAVLTAYQEVRARRHG